MIHNGMRAIHPGEILREDFLAPLGLTASALSEAIHIAAGHIDEILQERRDITPDIASKLASHFGGDAQSWLNLQQAYNLKSAMQETPAKQAP
ncbi:HigA family addiction module antitoxin [Oxalobacteraceae bacterium A2-2]